MPVFPGDPEVSFTLFHAIANTGYNVTQVRFGTHTGTHVDVPHHCLHDDRGVDRIELDALVGWAEVLDLGVLAPGSEITSADLDTFSDRVEDGARILLKTGWSKRWKDPSFFTDFPGVSEGAALWLNQRKVKLLGLEQPSVHTTLHLEVHKALLVGGMVVVETMANLHQLTQDRVYLVALPLKLTGADGSPMRVIAIQGQSAFTPSPEGIAT